jgi:hypothetical protein
LISPLPRFNVLSFRGAWHSREANLLPIDHVLQIGFDDGSQQLSALRDRLIRRRRGLVDGIQATVTSQLNGDDLVRVQNEIEAVERAMAEEKRAEFRV